MAASALLAVVAATTVSVAYAEYFSKFDLSPETAGMDSTAILTGSIPGVILLVIAISAGLGVLYTLANAARDAAYIRHVNGIHGRQSRIDIAVFAATFVGAVCLFALYFGALVDAFDSLVPIDPFASSGYVSLAIGAAWGVIGGIIGIALANGIIAFLMWKRGVRPFVVLRYRSYVISTVSVAPTVLVIVAVFLPLAAGAKANEVIDGVPVRPSAIFGVPLLGLSAPIVNIAKSPITLPTGNCYLLIGTGDTYTSLYDSTTENVYQIPKGDLVFSLPPDPTPCNEQ